MPCIVGDSTLPRSIQCRDRFSQKLAINMPLLRVQSHKNTTHPPKRVIVVKQHLNPLLRLWYQCLSVAILKRRNKNRSMIVANCAIIINMAYRKAISPRSWENSVYIKPSSTEVSSVCRRFAFDQHRVCCSVSNRNCILRIVCITYSLSINFEKQSSTHRQTKSQASSLHIDLICFCCFRSYQVQRCDNNNNMHFCILCRRPTTDVNICDNCRLANSSTF